MTAVELIEEGIKAREKYWHDQYQQGYQRALSDIMLYIEEAKQMEKEQQIENNKLKAIVEFYEQGCGKEECKVKEPHVH